MQKNVNTYIKTEMNTKQLKKYKIKNSKMVELFMHKIIHHTFNGTILLAEKHYYYFMFIANRTRKLWRRENEKREKSNKIQTCLTSIVLILAEKKK